MNDRYPNPIQVINELRCMSALDDFIIDAGNTDGDWIDRIGKQQILAARVCSWETTLCLQALMDTYPIAKVEPTWIRKDDIIYVLLAIHDTKGGVYFVDPQEGDSYPNWLDTIDGGDVFQQVRALLDDTCQDCMGNTLKEMNRAFSGPLGVDDLPGFRRKNLAEIDAFIQAVLLDETTPVVAIAGKPRRP